MQHDINREQKSHSLAHCEILDILEFRMFDMTPYDLFSNSIS